MWSKVCVVGNAKRCPRQAGRCAQRIVHKCTALQVPSGAGPLPCVSPRGRRARSQLARYGQAFKDRAVGRLLPPHSATPDELAREIGVSASTLERWRADALAQPWTSLCSCCLPLHGCWLRREVHNTL
ncbi:transposase [Acidovorax citrulli]|nr:transposase [Paracidovorax citrulli]MVT38072.1 transposase [Paracidovorax citrulli]UMT84936.1 transposase [Paracidovorax citrulli]UMT86937.1 transposase [Paracidovorax citrulli]